MKNNRVRGEEEEKVKNCGYGRETCQRKKRENVTKDKLLINKRETGEELVGTERENGEEKNRH